MNVSNKESLIYKESLGYILKLIRTKIFNVSLLDFGEILCLSSSTYHRYENNDFGKTFDKNRFVKLKNIAQRISYAIFGESVISLNSYIDREFINLGFNKKLKDLLIEEYKKVKHFNKNKLEILKSYDIEIRKFLEEYLYVFFMLFLNYDYNPIEFNNRNAFNKNISISTIKNRIQLEKESRLKRMSLGMSMLDEETNSYDRIYKYQINERYEYFDVNSGHYFTYRYLEITNETTDKVNCFSHREYCEEKINFCEMNIRACLNTKEKLIVENLHLIQPSIIQTFKIIFPFYLNKGETAKFYLYFKCPEEVKSFPKTEPFTTSISLKRYVQGVRDLTFGVLSNHNICNINLEEIPFNYDIVKKNLIHQQLSAKRMEEFKYIFNDNTIPKYGFMYKFKNPNVLGYRFHFKINF